MLYRVNKPFLPWGSEIFGLEIKNLIALTLVCLSVKIIVIHKTSVTTEYVFSACKSVPGDHGVLFFKQVQTK